MEITIDDLSDARIAEFLEQHLEDMKSVSPPESKHALDLDGLKQPDITFWTVWQDDALVGCGALKELDSEHGEIKSMRTDLNSRGTGVGSFILRHLMNVAIVRGYRRLSLETGSMPFFEPARQLYSKFGFTFCDPFADYKLDPNSVFMTRTTGYHARGECSCGAVQIYLTMPEPIEHYSSRACDCDFCTIRHIEYISHPDGEVVLKSDSPLAVQMQGSNQAEFLACASCEDVITASYPGKQRIGSLNATLLVDYDRLNGSDVVSPKLLDASDKLARWQTLWMPIHTWSTTG